MESERRSQRYPSHRPLQIRCESWTEFVETYASDICRGGMFIRCEEAPEVLSEVELKLSLPDRVEVSLLARVVHVVPVDIATQTNRIPGMGVEFIHASPEQKRQILQLVEFAKTQQEGGDENTSFAHTLLQNEPMHASEVGARLSMMPESSQRKASQTMAAVQLNDAERSAGDRQERPDASQVGVRTRPLSAPLDRQPIPRSPTQPVGSPTSRSSAHTPIVRTPTSPLGATGRSSVNTPIVRTPTGPLTGATGRSSASTPIVRTPTGPLTAAGARPNSAPIARGQSVPIDPSMFASNRPREQAQSGPISGAPNSPSGTPDPGTATAQATTPSGQPLPPPKPTDLNRLKIVLNSLAHKHFEDAAKQAREMLIDNPGDPQVLKWQAVCFARMALARNDQAAAAEQYEKVLRYEDNNREAREFVKTFNRDKKLGALPFGRYFVKKK
jgi:uncharacterized protein (TIGR02266 family)